MDILGHLIKTGSIVGISPLFLKEYPDMAYRLTVRPVQLIFDIHAIDRSIEIKSDWFNVGTPDSPITDDIIQGKKLYKEYEEKYYAIRKEIAALIGDPIDVQTQFDNSIIPTEDNHGK